MQKDEENVKEEISGAQKKVSQTILNKADEYMQKLVNASSKTKYVNGEKDVKINQEQNQQLVQTQKSSVHERNQRESKDSNPTLQ